MPQSVVTMSFGQQVRRYRRQAGMTQEALAEAAQLSVRAISDIERGAKHVPRKETVALLSDALDVPIAVQAEFEAAARQLRATTSLSSNSTNLPPQSTSFIGRQREVEAIAALVQLRPLVTLVGTGGTGKTRLALEVGKRALETFPDGVYFVGLAGISRPDLVIPTLANAIGLVEWGETTLGQQLQAYLLGKQILLILDNFEHLTAAAAGVADLVALHRGVHLLSTSRSPLHLYGEQEFPIPALGLPTDADYSSVTASEAVTLFAERAQNVDPDFILTPENATAVASICVRLDGLPLAIELAAARTRLFAPAALLRRLDHRLALLDDGYRNLPERHQSVRGAIDWSYQLLDEREQHLLANLSVFAGGCTLEAAEVVNAEAELEVVTVVGSLVENSLLGREGTDEPRFLMLETVREYAAERLAAGGQMDAIRHRHAVHYSALATQGALELSGPRHLEWSRRLEQEHDNLRAALQWYSASGEFEAGLRLAVALMRFWELRGHLSEGRSWVECFLAGTQSPSLRATGLDAIARWANTQSDIDHAVQSLEEALSLAREHGDERAIAAILHSLGRVQWGIPGRALALLEESRVKASATGDTQLLARVLFDQALLSAWSGDLARAENCARESLALYLESGHEQGAAVTLEILSGVAYRLGDMDRARRLGDESAALLRRAGLGPDFLQSAELLSLEARDRGNYRQAELLLETALKMSDAGDYRPYRANYRRLLGLVARERGAYERATQLLEESLAELRDIQDLQTCAMAMVGLSDVARDLGDVAGVNDWCETALVRCKDTPASYTEGWALNNLAIVAGLQGDYQRAHDLLERALTFGSAFAPGYRAEMLASVGWMALDEGNVQRAVTAFAESLRLSGNTGPAWVTASNLEGIASSAAVEGAWEQAARIFGAAEAMRRRMGAPIWPCRRTTYERHRGRASDALGEEDFRTICEAGQSMSEAEAVAYVLERFAAPPTDVAAGKQPA